MIDAGATPNNVRAKAKRLVGNFGPRSVLEVIASLDDILGKGAGAAPVLNTLFDSFGSDSTTCPASNCRPWGQAVRCDRPRLRIARRYASRPARSPTATAVTATTVTLLWCNW